MSDDEKTSLNEIIEIANRKRKIMIAYVCAIAICVGIIFFFIIKKDFSWAMVIALFLVFPINALICAFFFINDNKVYKKYGAKELLEWINILASEEIIDNLYVEVLYYLRIILTRYSLKYSLMYPSSLAPYLSVFAQYIQNKDFDNNPSEMKRLCGVLVKEINSNVSPTTGVPDKNKSVKIKTKIKNYISLVGIIVNVILWTILVLFKIYVTVYDAKPLENVIFNILYNVGGDVLTVISFAVAFFTWKRFN